MVFDNGKVTYAENEPSPGDVSVSCLVASFMISTYASRSLVLKLFWPSYDVLAVSCTI